MTDRELLLPLVAAGSLSFNNNGVLDCDKLVDYLLENGVTVEKHAYWVQAERSYVWECSRCGYTISSGCTPYCGKCAAKMSKEEYADG